MKTTPSFALKFVGGIVLFVPLLFMNFVSIYAEETSLSTETFISLTRTPTSLEQLPTNVSVIKAEDIEASGAKTLSDVLDRVAGVDVSRSGGLGTLSSVRLRGVPTANQVQILVDNQPLAGSSIQDFDISLLPVDNIERIEIVRGGASVLYGANTIGGVVHVITRKPTSDKSSFSASYEAGSLKTQVASAEKMTGVGSFHSLINVGGFKTDGYQQNSQVDDTHVTGNVNYALENGGRINLDLFHTERDLGNPNGTPVPFEEWDGKKERQSNSLTSTIENQLSTARLSATIPTPFFQMETLAYHSDGRYQIRISPDVDPFATHNDYISGADTHFILTDGSLIGFSYERDQRISLGQTPHQITDTGAYFQENLNISNLKLYPALRYDHHSVFGSQYNPRISAVLPVMSQWKVSANAARSFRSPKLSDLYDDYVDPLFPAFNFFGNRNLQPEKAWTYDVGTEVKLNEKLSASVTGFLTKISNRIASVDTDGNGNDDTLINASRAKIEGVESSVFLRTGSMGHILSHTFQQAYGNSVTSSQSVPLRMTPRHAFYYENRLPMPLHLVLFNDLQYVSRQFQKDGDNGTRVAPHALWNARLEDFPRPMFKIFFSVENITDRLYAESVTNNIPVPQPTRTYWAGLKASFGNVSGQ